MQVLVNLPENVLSFIYEHGFVNADDRNTVNHALLECIELPEGLVSDCKGYLLPHEVEIRLARAVKIGTVIPDNATNGDMIKAMFPNATFMIDEEKDEQGTKNLYVYTDDFEGFTVDLDWWNAPYNGVEE